MRHTLFCCIFFLFMRHLAAQPFTAVINSSSHAVQFGTAICSAGDRLLIGGTVRDEASALTKISLIYTNQHGTKLSEKIFSLTGRNYYCHALIPYPSGRFALLGYRYHPVSKEANWSLSLLDSALNIRWEKEYGDTLTGESMIGITLSSDLGFVVCGFKSTPGAAGNNEYVVRIDSTGAVVWEQEYPSDLNTVSMSIVPDAAGNFVIAADHQQPGEIYNIRLKKIDPSGQILWQQDVQSDLNGGCKALLRTSSGEYIVAGESSIPLQSRYDVYLVKFNDDGVILKKAYNGIPLDSEAGFSLFEYKPGYFVIGGYSDRNDDKRKMAYLVTVDSSLQQLSQRYYGDSSLNFFNQLIPFRNGFAAIGNTTGVMDHFFLVYDEIGNFAGIDEQALPFRVYPNPVSSSNGQLHLKGLAKGTYHLDIIDACGSVRFSLAAFSADQLEMKDLGLSPGIYQVRLRNSRVLYSSKILAF